jgi:hypothetical protein
MARFNFSALMGPRLLFMQVMIRPTNIHAANHLK